MGVQEGKRDSVKKAGFRRGGGKIQYGGGIQKEEGIQ